jgi:bifunctional UDP-N-acetylglucosamine pyrophosphorylase/glucosamine-1-phosphate N-acetyltransferase
VSTNLTAPAAIVLAAGQGTRMRSRIPKVLHLLAGRPLILHVLDALAGAGVARPVVVTGHGGDAVDAAVGDRAVTARQEPQRGTGDAVRVGLGALDVREGAVLVAMGDSPMIPPAVFGRLLEAQRESGAPLALLSARVSDPSGYGRIVRDAGDRVAAIVEEADADDAVRALDEVNAGAYAFDLAWLSGAIGRVKTSSSGELYLTDVIALAAAEDCPAAVVTADDPADVMGINDRVALSVAEERMRRRIAERHMRDGVTIVDPSTTRIDADVEIGQDARIEPWTILSGSTVIAQDAVIGPHANVRDSRIGARTTVWASVIEESTVAEDVAIGPYAHLRPGAEVGPRCRIGNFAEIKNSRLGAGTQQHHFSYLGDADIGGDVNVGAGSVTANFDGRAKHRTVVGDHVSLGVDTMMVAPVTIGEGAITGAGSVVTRDVAPGKTVVGIPARPITPRRTARDSAAGAGSEPAGDAPVPSGADRNP